MAASQSTPHSIVVGAGMVGLSTAWFLRQKGHEVTVIDRDGVAAGSSWGNAGWLSPGKTIPLANTELWRYTPQAFFNPDAALHVPLPPSPQVIDFGVRFMAHATQKAWDKTMAALTPIDLKALDAYDEMVDGGVESWTKKSPFIIAFKNEQEAEGFIHEVEGAVRHGQDVPFEEVANPREFVPFLSDNAQLVFQMGNQRYFEPGPFCHKLADALRDGVQVAFTYWAASSDTTSHRTVSPAQIYVREGESYLIAWQEDRGAHRTFRLDRMRDLQVLDTPATPHKDELKFDAEDPFGYDRYEEAVLDIHPDATWLAEHYDIEFHIVDSDDRVVEGEFARVVNSAALDAELSGTDDDGYDPDDPDDAPIDDPLPQLTTASDGWVRATMPVASEEWMVRFCLGQADRLRVVGPQKLVDAVARAASAARDRYTQ